MKSSMTWVVVVAVVALGLAVLAVLFVSLGATLWWLR